MLDIKFIRKNIDLVKQAIKLKNDHADVDKLLELDQKKRDLLSDVEEMKHRRNTVSDQIAKMKKEKQDASEIIAEMKELSGKIKQFDDEIKSYDEQIYEILIRIPNIPHESVPIGDCEEYNIEIKRWGESEKKDFEVQPHWEIGEKLGIIDLQGGSTVAGASFINYKGPGAKLQRALISFMLDLHIEKHGYTEVYPPYISNRQAMFGSGQIPKMEDRKSTRLNSSHYS